LTALTLLVEIIDFSRFPDGEALSSFAGLHAACFHCVGSGRCRLASSHGLLCRSSTMGGGSRSLEAVRAWAGDCGHLKNTRYSGLTPSLSPVCRDLS